MLNYYTKNEVISLENVLIALTALVKKITCFSLSSLVSIIRGQVLTADGTPLIGVNVTFVHYPEHGYTLSRKDGMCVFLYIFTQYL